MSDGSGPRYEVRVNFGLSISLLATGNCVFAVCGIMHATRMQRTRAFAGGDFPVEISPDLLLDQVDKLKAELDSKHSGYLSHQQFLDTLMLQLTSK